MPDPAASRPRRRRLRWLLLPVAALAAAGAFQVSRGAAPPAAPVPPAERPLELAAAEIVTVTPQHLRETVRLVGSLRPIDQTIVRSQVNAVLSEVLVREGEAVAAGQVLARFQTRDLQAKLDEKLGTLAVARAQLAMATKTRDNDLELQRRGVIAQTTLDQAQSSFQVALATVAVNQAQVEMMRKALEDAVVSAPMAGIVAERAAWPGESVALNGKLFSIVDLSRLEVEAPVPDTEIGRVRIGQTAAFTVEGLEGRSFVGRIARIAPVTQSGSRSVPVYAVLDNPDPSRGGGLRGGLFARGRLVVAEADGALAVPASALRRDGGGDYVLAVGNGVLTRLAVRRGAVWPHDDLVEVAGIPPGTVVVTAPLPGLAAGRAVSVQNPTPS